MITLDDNSKWISIPSTGYNAILFAYSRIKIQFIGGRLKFPKYNQNNEYF
jgi:hypothetical protein